MPAPIDYVVAVTPATGPASRERQKRVVVRGDFLALLVKKVNNMDMNGPAAITCVTKQFTISNGRGNTYQPT